MVINPTEFQLHLFHEGTLYHAYDLFGAHVIKRDSKTYTRFCVWAPQAENVSLVGDFNNWDGGEHRLQRVNNEGVWVIFVESDMTGVIYKYEIHSTTEERLLKADPFGFYSETRPNTASVVYPLEGYQWNDHKWMQKREKLNAHCEPMSIYEVHAASWKKGTNGRLLTYRELADDLVPYVVAHGYTHIELLPLTEHPLDDSWGYQTTGYFCATSRYGTPHDLMYFIDLCHQNGIGVILDWVPGHFCKDNHGLYRFDGTFVYEYKNEHDRENYVWGTANFDLGRTEVQSFLISSAIFWIDKYHVDGFRVDAVANIIYWPNSEKAENPYGIEFLQKLNKTVLEFEPSVLMFAEDSTDWPQVTAPVEYGGLGFSYKWNMGWMNDILKYMEADPSMRGYLHDKVTFSLMYAFSENFVLPLSHDEVVHGKKSLLDKMPGDYWRKFAQLRLLLGYLYTHPGKKLTFMGTELGHFAEWKDKEELDWHLLDYDLHKKANVYGKDLLKIYKRSKPLYELDHRYDGFEWIDADNRHQSIFSFIRKSMDPETFVIVVCNFTEKVYTKYRVGVPQQGSYREILNSDMEIYGGSGVINKKVLNTSGIEFHGKPFSVEMNIPPFGISILRPVKRRKERKTDDKEKVRSNAVGRRKGKQA
ncbi:1,4-alpha-glucan branching protein GlgB [Bacillus sp. T33-2]|uniref:1,4-alpha-glucan branching protein GlgB n=1 Tax=Bacillus sp. T33-2 TaxID=2054168 RepID=UPI000C78D11D|nr:1,4-alpha-glucan branching protein GlgB [Bacillus sp. T33-2]PLR98282.1 1,4-alpha-glucan branching enzyme [Bacillus sp. T33-2]